MNNNDLIMGFDDEKNNDLQISLVKSDKVPNCLFFELKGQIDTYNSNWFQKRAQMAINSGFKNLVFVCYGVGYMSSTGVGAFASLFKILGTLAGNIAIIGIQPRVMEIFKILGFEQFFFFGNHREDAITYFETKLNTKNAVYPRIFACPICDKKLKAIKSGKYRCPNCKTILALDDKANIQLV